MSERSLICQQCGNTFVGDSSRKYCSPECKRAQHNARRSPNKYAQRECPICGKTFGGTSEPAGGRIYCSTKCWNAEKRRRKRKTRTISQRVCPGCGKFFYIAANARGRKRKYCSEKCKNDYMSREATLQKRQEYKKAAVRKICPNCGRRFTERFGRGQRRRFCSKECSIMWHNPSRARRPQAASCHATPPCGGGSWPKPRKKLVCRQNGVSCLCAESRKSMALSSFVPSYGIN